MTYLHMLWILGAWILTIGGAFGLVMTCLLMLLSLGELPDDWKVPATVWVIGFPIVFFGGPAWVLLCDNMPT